MKWASGILIAVTLFLSTPDWSRAQTLTREEALTQLALIREAVIALAERIAFEMRVEEAFTAASQSAAERQAVKQASSELAGSEAGLIAIEAWSDFDVIIPDGFIDPHAASEFIAANTINDDGDVGFTFEDEEYVISREEVTTMTEAEVVLEEWEAEFRRLEAKADRVSRTDPIYILVTNYEGQWPVVETNLREMLEAGDFKGFSDTWQLARAVTVAVEEYLE